MKNDRYLKTLVASAAADTATTFYFYNYLLLPEGNPLASFMFNYIGVVPSAILLKGVGILTVSKTCEKYGYRKTAYALMSTLWFSAAVWNTFQILGQVL